MRVCKGILIPEIDENKCTQCGLCVKCCPGFFVDFKSLNLEIFGKQPKDRLLGNYLNCYIGYSNDKEIRFNSSSGGIITQLLIFALENGLIDGAIVTRMRKDDPLKPESFIARTKKEIISASKSKYCPTSTNEVLKYVLKKNEKYAFVGLPCQIHGIRKAERNIKDLRKKIIFHIGLFCSHNVSFYGTEFLLKKFGISPDRVTKVAYRGTGWPGYMVIELNDSSKLIVPYTRGFRAYWSVFSCFYFTPMRCLMCGDCTAELADISVGDAWLPQFRKNNKGVSVVIARTEYGDDFLNLARSQKVVSLKPITSDDIRKSQKEPLKFKKYDLATRLNMLRTSGKDVPFFNVNFISSESFLYFLRNSFVLINVKASKKRTFRRLLLGVPLPFFRLFYGVYKFLCLI